MKLTPELMAAICARHLTARETQEMGYGGPLRRASRSPR